MKNIVTKLAITFLTIISLGCSSQKNNAHSLSYKMKIVRTDNTIQPVCYFELLSDSKINLANEGWKIYFNSFKNPRIEGVDSVRFGIKHVNGDVYFIHPKEGYTAAGGNLIIPITQAYLKNISDFPVGFYLVLDSNPSETYPIENIDPTYETIAISENDLAKDIYDKNSLIADIPRDSLIQIIPTPNSYKTSNAEFILDENTLIITDNQYQNTANFLVKEIEKHTGLKLETSNDFTKSGILLKSWSLPREAYQLKIDNQRIELFAGSTVGMFYAVQSLKSIILNNFEKKDTRISLKGIDIEDEPRFAHRAIMLDVVRNFQSKERILNVLDHMATYKLNVLHFHLNDDEGWRLEIPGLPELTEIASVRGHLLESNTHLPASHGSGPKTGTLPGSGHYSRKDFIEILKYANERHITIIPEIETPGHARAAIKAMEARYDKYIDTDSTEAKRYLLSDYSDKSIYKTVQGWNDNVISVALPSTYNFIEKTVEEIVKIYKEANAPLNTIHMGGDEVPAGVWEKSPVANKFVAEVGTLNYVDDLWVYYFDKVNDILKKHNLFMSGWEEIGMKRVDVNGKKKMEIVPELAKNNFQLDVWNNVYGTGAEDLAYRLANAGFKVILSNVTHLYLDMAANKSFYEPGMFWGGYIDVEKPYYFVPYNYYKTFKFDDLGNPIDPDSFHDKVKLTEEGENNIVGLQAPLWSETLINHDDFEYMLHPKLMGFAERAWSKDPEWAKATNESLSQKAYNEEWSTFVNRIWKFEFEKYDKFDYKLNYRIPTPGVSMNNNQLVANTESNSLEIRYTVDGSSPTVDSPKYSEPLTQKGTYKFKSFNKNGRSSKLLIIDFE